jgi:SAM-dependent methyltransferase
MSKHQRTTSETYDAVAADFLERTRDFSRGRDWIERFASALPCGALVADLGSGPGRDTARLRARGLDVFCLDLSIGMLRSGRLEFPAPRVQGSMLSLPLRSACLDGAWANASLLHFTPDELRVALREIRRVLAPSGRLHVTVKVGEGAEWESAQYGRPRFFQYWTSDAFDRELNAARLVPVHASQESSTSNEWLVRSCRAD